MSAFFSGLWAKLALVVAGAAIVAGILLKVRSDGRSSAFSEVAHRNVEIKHEQLEAANRRPASRDELRDRMRNGTF